MEQMEQSVIFTSICPKRLTEVILEGVQAKIDKLKATFQPKEPTEYLTRKEVKELLHVDLSTVHNWTKRGKLTSYGIGNRVYYKRLEVEQAIKPIQTR